VTPTRLLATGAIGFLTACGTTVPQAAPPGALSTLEPSTGLAGPPVATQIPRGDTGLAPGSVPAPTASAATGGPTGTGGAPGRPDVALTGPGVSATTITIGVTYLDNGAGSSYASSFGLKGLELGDVRAQVHALQSYINSHGGLAHGRALQVVMHPLDLSQSLSANAQAACADFTQDHKIYAAFSAITENYPNDTFVPCLARSGALTLSGAYVPGSSKAFFARYPSHYYAPGQFESVAAARTYVDGLHSAGYFSKGARVGLLYWDAPSFADAYRDGIVPALRRHGLGVTAAIPIRTAQTTSDAGPVLSSVQSAVLRFRSDRVDHVLFLDSGGALAQYFMTGAQNQGYSPRYGLSSFSALPLLEANASPSQLEDSLAVGWEPTHDVAETRLPRSTAARDCDRIMSAAGIRPASSLDHWVIYRLCSGVFFLQQVMGRATDWSPAGFRRTVEGLGSPVASNALGFSERYTAGKHWGTAAYRMLAFDNDCSCFVYTTGPQAIR
jgi:ABC-type branched-subunit amino acid transport system substrate-binding protein